MKCPVPCSKCGEWIELHDAHFTFEPGQCSSTCGLCDECFEEYEEDRRLRQKLEEEEAQ